MLKIVLKRIHILPDSIGNITPLIRKYNPQDTSIVAIMQGLYPAYCAACDDIERLFAEIHEMISQMQKEGLHISCMDDELLTCAMRKQHEIGKYYYRSNDYSRFLSYDKCLCEMLTNKPWRDDTIAHYTAIIA